MEFNEMNSGSSSDAALWELARFTYETMLNPPVMPWDVADFDEEPLLKLNTSVSSAILHANEFKQAVEALAADDDLAALRSIDETDGLLFAFPGGASGETMAMLPHSLMVPALRRAKIDPPESEQEFCRRVIDSFASLKLAIKGEPVEVLTVHGLNRVSLPEGAQISTPWGLITPAPSETAAFAKSGRMAPTTAIMIGKCNVHVKIVRQGSYEREEHVEFYEYEKRVHTLLPLAFALGVDGERRCAPGLTFNTRIVPFVGGYGSSGRSFWIPGEPVQIQENEIAAIENWAKILDKNHDPSLEIAGRRLVSAIGERFDPDDRLIDGVVCWESLVGTRNETVNRVTTALAILLEDDIDSRAQMVKDLQDTYTARSSIVHGGQVKVSKRQAATEHAVEIAVKALRAVYSAGEPWVSGTSEKRSQRIVLGEWDRRGASA